MLSVDIENRPQFTKEAALTIQILIVDDRAVVRAELRHLLELSGSVSVIGEAADGWEALIQTSALKPDIVLMDLEMPRMNGFDATRHIKTLQPAPAVIVLTVYGDDSSQKKAIEVGADAFMIKGTDLQAMLNIFQKIASQAVDP